MDEPEEDTHRPDAAEILARALGTAPRAEDDEPPGPAPLPAPAAGDRESAQDERAG